MEVVDLVVEVMERVAIKKQTQPERKSGNCLQQPNAKTFPYSQLFNKMTSFTIIRNLIVCFVWCYLHLRKTIIIHCNKRYLRMQTPEIESKQKPALSISLHFQLTSSI